MKKALIVYASLSGNTEAMAHLVAEEFEELGASAVVRECSQARAEEFLDYDICVVATYTLCSDDNLPDEIIDFYVELAQLNLTGKVYGVLGSGQDFYEDYCKAVDRFDHVFRLVHARKGTESLKIEYSVEDEDLPKIKKFARDLMENDS